MPALDSVTRPVDPRIPIPALLAAATALVMGAGLLAWMVTDAGERSAYGLAVGAFFVALAGVLVLAPRVTDPVVRVALLAAATAGLVSWGVVGIFSIGFPLLVAGFLAAWALVECGPYAGGRWALGAALVGGAVGVGPAVVALV